MELAGGLISENKFFLKVQTEVDALSTGLSLFHSNKQLGQKLVMDFSVLALIFPVAGWFRKA